MGVVFQHAWLCTMCMRCLMWPEDNIWSFWVLYYCNLFRKKSPGRAGKHITLCRGPPESRFFPFYQNVILRDGQNILSKCFCFLSTSLTQSQRSTGSQKSGGGWEGVSHCCLGFLFFFFLLAAAAPPVLQRSAACGDGVLTCGGICPRVPLCLFFSPEHMHSYTDL